MTKRMLPLFLLALPIHIETPPLGNPADPAETRSVFSWLTEPAFPQAVTVAYRVTGHSHTTPAPWETVWVVLGSEQRFLAFVGKTTGWHVDLVDTSQETKVLASGEWPAFPDGELHKVTLAVCEDGFGVEVENADIIIALLGEPWRACWTWQGDDVAPDDVGPCASPRPDWMGEPMRGGVYLEDAEALLEKVEVPGFTPDWEIIREPGPLPKPKKSGGGLGCAN